MGNRNCLFENGLSLRQTRGLNLNRYRLHELHSALNGHLVASYCAEYWSFNPQTVVLSLGVLSVGHMYICKFLFFGFAGKSLKRYLAKICEDICMDVCNTHEKTTETTCICKWYSSHLRIIYRPLYIMICYIHAGERKEINSINCRNATDKTLNIEKQHLLKDIKVQLY